MNGVVTVGLVNAVSATALALVAAGLSRFVRRPDVLHTLWLLVLLDLLTPPVVVVGILPAVDLPVAASSLTAAVRTDAASPADAGVARPAPAVVSRPGAAAASAEAPAGLRDGDDEHRAATRGGNVLGWLGPAWLVGSALALLATLVGVVRFERRLARGAAAPEDVARRAGVLARELGLARAPPVRLVSARVSPMLWFRPGRTEIVLPAHLLHRLAPAELDALLAHELAHLRRGDHRVRWLELVATVLFFWHPVVWWARTELRRSEERSCDAWVRRVLPARNRDYAAGLIKTLEFLSAARGAPVPALASGLGHFRRLEERLTMILKSDPPPFPSRAQRLALAACGVAFLLLFPGAAERRAASDEPVVAERDRHESRSASDEAAAIEAELRDLERRHSELAGRLHELRRTDDERQLREEISRLESEGRGDEARQLALEADRRARLADLERERESLDRGRDEATAEIEAELLEVEREAERAEAAGRQEDAERQRETAARLQQELATRAMEFDRRQVEIDVRARAMELERAAEEARRLAAEGDAEGAAQIRRELEHHAQELARDAKQRQADLERASVHHEAQVLDQRAEELERAGREDEARELHRRAEEMARAAEVRQRAAGRTLRDELARIRAELARLVDSGAADGVGDAEIDELRRELDELERTLERMDETRPESGEVY